MSSNAMKTGEESTPAKTSKPATAAPEAPAILSYPDWSSSIQAYYGAGAIPPPFFASTVTSPTPHPYMWGGQHPLIPPYGTPVPYPAIYPAGGIYAHPNMATVPSITQTNTELEGKGHEGKDRASAKKIKGALGGKTAENGKATSGSGNDGASQSAESGSEGSSDASDEDNNQQEPTATKNGRFEQMIVDAHSPNNKSSSGANLHASVPWKPSVSMPATNLNIGLDLWNSSPTGAAAGSSKMRSNISGASSGVVPSGMSDQWMQPDERELKRQKRKQSNRESARRSRLRKQAECEELQARVQTLSYENRDLRDEMQRLSEECDRLKSENDSIMDELKQLHGPDAVADLERSNPSLVLQCRSSEENN